MTILPEVPDLSRRDAAILLGRPMKTLAAWARKGIGPAFYQLSPRRAFYRLEDLQDFIRASRKGPATSHV